MKKAMKRAIAAVIAAVITFLPVGTAYAAEITEVATVEMYTTSGTPVYAEPDVYTDIVLYLDRFTNVRVTGITDTGFYRVDLNGDYYIPGPYLVTQIEEEKTAKEQALEDLEDLVDAYKVQLSMMESYSSTFALKDVTGDGVPEIIDEAGKEIYTYYNGRAVMIYYSSEPVTFYYSKSNNKLMGKYTWNDTEIWEVYSLDKSLLAWGQFKCVSTDASSYKSDAYTISRDYTNDDETRVDLYNILASYLSL